MATHSFPVIIEVEETALGPVMKLLHKTPGVITFHVDMDGLGKKVKPNGHDKTRGGPGKTGRGKHLIEPVLREVGKHKGPITTEQFTAIYQGLGGRQDGVSAVRRYKDQKLLTPVGDKWKIGPKGETRLKKAAAVVAVTE